MLPLPWKQLNVSSTQQVKAISILHADYALSILDGKTDQDLKHLDICFGGRRKFCGGSYVDFGKSFTQPCLQTNLWMLACLQSSCNMSPPNLLHFYLDQLAPAYPAP